MGWDGHMSTGYTQNSLPQTSGMGGGPTPQAEQRGSSYCPLVVSSPACQSLSVVGTIKSVCSLQVMPLSLSRSLSLSRCVDITIPRSPPTHLSLSPWSTYCTTMLLYRVKSDELKVLKSNRSPGCVLQFVVTLSWAYVNMGMHSFIGSYTNTH